MIAATTKLLDQRPIARVRINYVRDCDRLDPLHEPGVQMYRDMIRARQKLPPLQVIRWGRGAYEILDGGHRLAAYRAEGRKYVDVRVVIS
jgi:ParB-like chromosome segregation protein Spo0J